MAKFCSNCGKQLDENADICLNCGVLVNKQVYKKTSSKTNNNSKKQGLPTWTIALIILGSIALIPLIIIILISILGIFTINTIRKDTNNYLDNARDYFDDFVEEYEEEVLEGAVGDTLEIDGIKFTLNSFSKYDSIGDNIPMDNNKYLVFDLDVYNTTDSDNKVITYMGFEGLVDGKKSNNVFLPRDTKDFKDLFRRLKSHEKANIHITFEVPNDFENFDLTYSNILNFKSITFYVTNEENNQSL